MSSTRYEFLAKLCLKPTSLCAFVKCIAWGEAILDAGYSMLVEDPVFSGDKDTPIYIAQEYYQFVVRPFSTD